MLWNTQTDRAINQWKWTNGKVLSIARTDTGWVVVTQKEVLWTNGYSTKVETDIPDSFYKVPPPKIGDAIRDTLTYPGVIITDDCSWLRILDNWPEPLASITDAAIVGVALTNNYDSVATFDQKLVRRMKMLGVRSYF